MGFSGTSFDVLFWRGEEKNRTMTFGGGLNDVSFAADPHCC
jgi:hypothetical protein